MKYIATVETNYGTEMPCLLKPHQHIGSLKEVKQFLAECIKLFPGHKYRVYELKEKSNDKTEG